VRTNTNYSALNSTSSISLPQLNFNIIPMHWKVLESTYLFNEPWLTVRRDKCELPNGNIMPAFYVNEYPSWVTAFALTTDNKVVMVKQYRHGIGEISIETPGGVVDAGEDPIDAIKRELLEETGYQFSSAEFLGKVCANPSTMNNYLHMFLLQGGEKIAEQKLDESEDVEVVYYSIDEVKELLNHNKIMQSLHVSCIHYALKRLGALSY
jgi:ADP-ribose pyrophosphatase